MLNTPQYIEIENYIKEKIYSNDFKIGDKLPSERELAHTFGVGRPTVREAILSLEIQGLLNSVQGKGTFICNQIKDNMTKSLSHITNISNIDIIKIVEYREMFEYSTVRLAAKNGTDEEIDVLKEILDGMEIMTDPQDMKKMDSKFHEQISLMSHNELISTTFYSMRHFFEESIDASVMRVLLHDESIVLYHKFIYESIRNRDGNAAYMFMQKHMQKVYDVLERE